MKKKWHQQVIDITVELCEEWKKRGKYKSIIRGSPMNPVTISCGRSVHFYQPDIYAYSKKGELDIYEFL